MSAARAYTPPTAFSPIQPTARPVGIGRVRLLPGPFLDRLEVNARFLLETIAPDLLLAGFRAQAGLSPKTKRHGGREARVADGHGLGHYLSALSILHAATGSDPARRRVECIVSELAACQAASGDGYVLPFAESAIDEPDDKRSETADSLHVDEERASDRTLRTVLAGLRDAWRFVGVQDALEVGRGLADHMIGIYEGMRPRLARERLAARCAGLAEVLADLTADTGDPRYLAFAQDAILHEESLAPLRLGRDELDGRHCKTMTARVLGLARVHELTGDVEARVGVLAFWNAVSRCRSFANGGHGDDEHFFPPERFSQKLGPRNAETCGTHDMIKLAGHVFSWAPQAGVMDFVERGMLNHILAEVGRRPGEFARFLPQGLVARKTFSSPLDDWRRCVDPGMENPGRYGEQIYFHHGNTLWVNLYIASRLDWSERGVVLRQETAFPETDTVRFEVETAAPVRFALRLRHPAWCEKPVLALNGRILKIASAPSSYIEIKLLWCSGDRLELRLPMKPQVEPLRCSGGRVVALMYGPLQLAARMPSPPDGPDRARRRDAKNMERPVLVAETTADLLSRLRPDPAAGFAAFRAEGLMRPADLALMPLHRIYEEHYTACFPVHNSAEWALREGRVRAEEAALAALEAATLDRVEPGSPRSEREHRLRFERSTSGIFRGRFRREATPGGWFAYRVAVDRDKPAALLLEHWSSDRGGEFEIWINDQHLVLARIRHEEPDLFFESAYAIPPGFTCGKTHITVRLVSPHGRIGVFGLRIAAPAAITAEQWRRGSGTCLEPGAFPRPIRTRTSG